MADQFKFDKKTLVDEGYTFRSWHFSFRELIMGLLLGVLLITCLFLAGFLGKSSTDLKQAQTGALAAQNACKGSTCLRTSAHIMELLNTSVSPCDDFYSFACGNYRFKNPVDESTRYQTIWKQMYQQNEDDLLAILNSPSKKYTEWSSERKVKHFFMSCMDDFHREQLKGKPLLDKVLPRLGGWYVIDGASWDSKTWDLDVHVKKVQTDFWMDALFATRIGPDEFDPKKIIIMIYPGGTGYYMDWSDFTENPTPKQLKRQNDYKKFMRTIAQLVARDAGLTTSNDQGLTNRIDVFVDDAYGVEARMAKFASSWDYRGTYSGAQKITLRELTRTTGGQIDWTEQMTYQFDQAGVTGDTEVLVPYPPYLTNLTAMIRSLHPDVRNRKLNNYLIWRVLETYTIALSGEYVHANFQMVVDRYGFMFREFMDMDRLCFLWTKYFFFNDALEALYIQARFDMKNKQKPTLGGLGCEIATATFVHDKKNMTSIAVLKSLLDVDSMHIVVTEITEAVKTAMEASITNNKWMDKATKDFAIAKMRGATYKIGFPDWLQDEAKVDAVYDVVTINQSDFIGNALETMQIHKREWNRYLKEGEDRSQWFWSAYDTTLDINWSWDEIIVPAGILRFPVYDYDMPHYYSFGALGSLLGHYVHHLVDEKGRRWDKGGAFMKADQGWWSAQTVQNYNTAKQCVADLYNNQTEGPYVIKHGYKTTSEATGADYAWEAIGITTGIRLAYNAYQQWQKKYGQDSRSPGLQYSPSQLFFIAHAQMYCYNVDPSYNYKYSSRVREEIRVNLALKQLPEFRQAFQCKATDNMVSPKPCSYF